MTSIVGSPFDPEGLITHSPRKAEDRVVPPQSNPEPPDAPKSPPPPSTDLDSDEEAPVET
jgi:hypothetical protein